MVATMTDTEVRKLAEWRRRRMLTIRALADLTDLSKTTINLIETGQRTPQFDTIRKLAAALGVEPEQIAECRPVMGLEEGR